MKDINIRIENTSDWKKCENVVRESFWNVYRPGCTEHCVLHKLRENRDFIPQLSFVMEKDGEIIGQNVFFKASLRTDEGKKITVFTMGPVCVLPKFQRQGLGEYLVKKTLETARDFGVNAVFIEGNIEFYRHRGFDYAKNFGIKYAGLPEGEDSSFFLCRELVPGFLKNIKGTYFTPERYFVTDREAEEFDKTFPPKEKKKLPGQIFNDL